MQGLSYNEINKLKKQFGPNKLGVDEERNKVLLSLVSKFKNPLVLILLGAAALSLFSGDDISFFIIFAIVLVSIFLDFINSFRSERAAESLKNKVRVMVHVIREGEEQTVPTLDLVPGDIVKLFAGKVIPADGEIVESTGLYINESSLTGESFPQTKSEKSKVYMGSGVISGSGIMQVTATGLSTKFSKIVADLQSQSATTEFDKEIKDFSYLIIKITFVLVIFVFVINAVFHHNVLEALLFSLALAVGLTPELLPLIITMNLTKGSMDMAKKGVIVKQLSAIQNLGSMDILCTDKTGTLTEDKIALIKYVDGNGNADEQVLQLGYLISYFSTSFESPLDTAVKKYRHPNIESYQKIDEIPFDFERKREAIVVHHIHQNERTLIVKGAPETVLAISTGLTKSERDIINQTYKQLSIDGFRVLAVASKIIDPEKHYQPNDENHVKFVGFLAFLDPAKSSVRDTIGQMEDMGVSIKIVTGDNIFVTEKIAREIGLEITGMISGEEMDALSEKEFLKIVDNINIFARVNPEQKLRIISALQKNKHVVGYMGDGINDAPSLRSADVGISVNNAVDVAKDAADFILLKKSLHQLCSGIIDGRKTFANTMKYLRMSLSSNFGNMFSMAGASLILPFLPMLATQILFNNLLYDASQFAIPFDNVDESDLKQPHKLGIASLKRFMWSFGLLSSVFDFITFGVLMFVFNANQSTFQAGWFIESIMTQVLVVYVIRSKMLPFKNSEPAPALIASTFLVLAIAFAAVLLPIGAIFGFTALKLAQVYTLIIIVVGYLFFAEIVKHWFFRATNKRQEN